MIFVAQSTYKKVNFLSTIASLTTRDLQNKAEYKGQSFNIGAGYSTGNSGVGKDNQGNATTGGTQTPGTTLPSLNGFSAPYPLQ